MDQTKVDQIKNSERSRHTARYFYSAVGVFMLAIMFGGFHPYYLHGKGMGGRSILPELFALVLVHGVSATAWVFLFFVQSLLIPTRRVRMHMMLGWGSVAIALVAIISGFILAVESVRSVPEMPFWGMAYRQFLMVMLTEVTLFTLFVLGGVLLRKRREAHRAMMMLASLNLLAGATVRMPVLFPIYGETGWIGIFGPIFTLGALLLLVRSLLDRTLDRWLAVGYATTVVVYIAACEFAVSNAWDELAKAIFGI